MLIPTLILLAATGDQGHPPIDQYEQLGLMPALCAQLFPKNERQRVACAKPPYIPGDQMAPMRACMAMWEAARKAGFEPKGKITLRKGKATTDCEFEPGLPKK